MAPHIAAAISAEFAAQTVGAAPVMAVSGSTTEAGP